VIDLYQLLEKLDPQPGGEDVLRLRVGTIDAVNANGTVSLILSGLVIPGVARLDYTSLKAGDRVQVLTLRGSLLVLGRVAKADGSTISRIGTVPRTSDSSTTNTTEILVTSVTVPLVSGRTYQIRWNPGIASSVSGDTAFCRIREDSVSGTQLQIMRGHMPVTGGAGTRWPCPVEVEYTAVATGSKTFAATIARISGTGNVFVASSPTYPSYLTVDYVRN
jgi:hypothetical protein